MKLAAARSLAVALFGLAVLGSQARAQTTTYGPPTLTIVEQKPTSVRLSVHGGDGGAPIGFAVEWMKKADFDATGWPALGAAPLHGEFSGTPTWVVQGNAGDFTLSAAQWQCVQLGELFDETGLWSTAPVDLDPGTEYAVRAYALWNTGDAASLPSATMFVATAAQNQNCTFTQGYWKNHPSSWPVTSLTLGTVTYSAADLLSILNTPAGGNGLLILAHQLIAAKLNIANGADASSVASDIVAADALIGSLVIPPIGGGFLNPADVNALATTLDDYNNGLIGPGHCATPARAQTWGELKASYRR